MEIDYQPLCQKLEELIKSNIIKNGLVSSGKMLSSISVSYSDGSFWCTAIDYFQFLYQKYDLLQDAVNSVEFTSFSEKYLSEQMEKNIETEMNGN